MVIDCFKKKLQSIFGICYVKASITVETTLVMPLILACIMLLLIMNGYLHDMVVINGISVEVLYSEADDKEEIFYESIQQRTLWMQDVDFSESEDLFKTTVTWQKTYSLPLKGLISLLIADTEIELSGGARKQAYSMSKIIRYVKQN